MRHKESTTIQPGNLTEHRGRVYMAARLSPSKPCAEQCALAGIADHAVCDGYCYRWDNGDGIVFRHPTPDIDIDPSAFVQTPDLIGMRLNGDFDDGREKSYRKYYSKKRGNSGAGGVYALTAPGKWRAEITIKGVRYTSSSMSREEAQQWLENLKLEKGIRQ